MPDIDHSRQQADAAARSEKGQLSVLRQPVTARVSIIYVSYNAVTTKVGMMLTIDPTCAKLTSLATPILDVTDPDVLFMRTSRLFNSKVTNIKLKRRNLVTVCTRTSGYITFVC